MDNSNRHCRGLCLGRGDMSEIENQLRTLTERVNRLEEFMDSTVMAVILPFMKRLEEVDAPDCPKSSETSNDPHSCLSLEFEAENFDNTVVEKVHCTKDTDHKITVDTRSNLANVCNCQAIEGMFFELQRVSSASSNNPDVNESLTEFINSDELRVINNKKIACGDQFMTEKGDNGTLVCDSNDGNGSAENNPGLEDSENYYDSESGREIVHSEETLVEAHKSSPNELNGTANYQTTKLGENKLSSSPDLLDDDSSEYIGHVVEKKLDGLNSKYVEENKETYPDLFGDNVDVETYDITGIDVDTFVAAHDAYWKNCEEKSPSQKHQTNLNSKKSKIARNSANSDQHMSHTRPKQLISSKKSKNTNNAECNSRDDLKISSNNSVDVERELVQKIDSVMNISHTADHSTIQESEEAEEILEEQEVFYNENNDSTGSDEINSDVSPAHISLTDKVDDFLIPQCKEISEVPQLEKANNADVKDCNESSFDYVSSSLNTYDLQEINRCAEKAIGSGCFKNDAIVEKGKVDFNTFSNCRNTMNTGESYAPCEKTINSMDSATDSDKDTKICDPSNIVLKLNYETMDNLLGSAEVVKDSLWISFESTDDPGEIDSNDITKSENEFISSSTTASGNPAKVACEVSNSTNITREYSEPTGSKDVTSSPMYFSAPYDPCREYKHKSPSQKQHTNLPSKTSKVALGFANTDQDTPQTKVKRTNTSKKCKNTPVSANNEKIPKKYERGDGEATDANMRSTPQPKVNSHQDESSSAYNPLYVPQSLLEASESGHIRAARRFLSRGSPVEQRDANGDQPIHIAARNGHTRIVEHLLRSGASKDARGAGGRTPLHAAAFGGHEDVVKTLLMNKASVVRDDFGDTALTLARKAGHWKVTAILENSVGLALPEDDHESFVPKEPDQIVRPCLVYEFLFGIFPSRNGSINLHHE